MGTSFFFFSNTRKMQSSHSGVGVVIQLSPFQESCHRALLTVQKHLPGVKNVVIVSSRELHRKREDDKKYPNLKIAYQVTPDGKPNYDHIPFNMVHNIPPDLQCNRPEFLQQYLQKRVEKTKTQHRHGLIPQMNFQASEFSFFYVFWALIFVIDWWRNLFASFTLHTGHYWCSYEILHGYKRAIETPHKSPWLSCCGYWAKGDRSSLMASSRFAVATGPSSDFDGWRYFLYTFYRRQLGASANHGKRLWWVIFLAYSALVGITWWSPVISWITHFVWSATKLHQTVGLGVPLAIDNFTNPWGTFQIAFKVVQAVFHGLLLRRYVVWNNILYTIVVPLLFPLFMPVLGIVMVIANVWLKYPQFEEDLQTFEDENLEETSNNVHKMD